MFKQYILWLLKLITIVVIFVFVIPILLAASLGAGSGELSVADKQSGKLVAVIELVGIIDSSKDILENLYEQIADKDVAAVVLRINSPGGAVGPSQDIYSAVMKLKQQKPIVASMGAVAASGGLYSAVGASKVYCQPGTLTGSLGVIMNLPNFHRIAEKIGFEMMTVKSGKFKDVGNSFREMTEEERAFLQATIERVEEDFVQAVAKGRGLAVENVREFADGRVILGSQAKELKLVDDFGDVYDAARVALELSGVPLAAGEMPKLYYPMDKLSQVKRLFNAVDSLPNIFSSSMELKYLMP